MFLLTRVRDIVKCDVRIIALSSFATASLAAGQSISRSLDSFSSSSKLPPLICPSLTRASKSLLLSLPRSLQQYYLATAAASEDGGPPQSKVSVIPFTVDQDKALETFNAYHFGALFSRKSSHFETIEQVYVPFWVTSATVQVTVRSADIGVNYLTRRYNPQTKREESQWETRWQTVYLTMTWQSHHEAKELDMQVSATDYPQRPRMRSLRPGDQIRQARTLTPDMLADGEGRARKLLPWTLKPEVGRSIALSWLDSGERNEAERLIKANFRCDQVRLINMDITHEEVVTSPIYAPLFIFSTMHMGQPLQTLVSGMEPPAAAGTRIYDEKIVAAVTAKIMLIWVAACLFAPGGSTFMHSWGFGGLLLLVGVPPMVTAAIARYLPLAVEGAETARQAVGDAWHARKNREAAWDAEWVRPYSSQAQFDRRTQFEQRSRQRFRDEHREGGGWADEESPFGRPRSGGWQQQSSQQRRQQQQREGWPGTARAAPGGDHLGYYAALGLKPGADDQDIRTSFHQLAKEHHPDRVTTPAQKAEATRRFQRITEAYNVLRDPDKKRQYDQGITPK